VTKIDIFLRLPLRRTPSIRIDCVLFGFEAVANFGRFFLGPLSAGISLGLAWLRALLRQSGERPFCCLIEALLRCGPFLPGLGYCAPGFCVCPANIHTENFVDLFSLPFFKIKSVYTHRLVFRQKLSLF
jgi:hypothetical protein